jgi:hypothetical protein
MGMSASSELLERTADLLRQERLLTDVLASGAATGEQRRVQTALLRDTRQEIARARQAARAVEAGWEPFEPATDWHWGYVEDPRFLRGQTRLVSWLLALPLAAGAGVGLAQRWEVLAAIATAAVLWLGLQATIHEALGRLGEGRDATRKGDQEKLRIFNAPMPTYATVAYKRARESDLFETFVVCSPRAEDFREVSGAQAPSLGLLDPVLVGRIGSYGFLIAQWDLAKDLGQIP